MKDPVLLIPLLVPLGIILFVLVRVIPVRLRMERRAKDLVGRMPQHELRTVYLAFSSGWYWGKGKEMAAKISEEEKAGWTFLKASEANMFKTSLSWGGGVNLHFIRQSTPSKLDPLGRQIEDLPGVHL
jgi:hypothetical protein